MPSSASTWDTVQDNQQAKITTALGANAVFLESFTAREALSEPFVILCNVLGPSELIAWRPLIGSRVSIEVTSGANPGKVARYFHAVLAEVTVIEEVELGIRYSLVLRPWLWALSLGSGYSIYQDKSAVDIVADMFKEMAVTTEDYRIEAAGLGATKRNYCVQYDESAFAFVSRILEEEGLSYHFEHSANRHVMVIGGDNNAFTSFGGGPLPLRRSGSGLDETYALWSEHHRISPALKTYFIEDYAPYVYKERFGGVKLNGPADGTAIKPGPTIFHHGSTYAWFTDSGTVDDGGKADLVKNVTAIGDSFAGFRMDAESAGTETSSFEGNVFAVACGQRVFVQKGAESREIVVTSATHRVMGQWPESHDRTAPSEPVVSFEGYESAVVPWRPPLRTPKPYVRGPLSAIVTGAKADDEVPIDDHGRVHVQFQWDIYQKFDATSSCWIRVATSWAGPNMGESFHPRLGHEVIVDFMAGDPDRPIITGRVYNDRNKILGFPAKNSKTVSGWRTQTVYGKSTQDYDGAIKTPTDEPGFNYLAWDDQSGAETFSMHAQRDFGYSVNRDEKSSVNRDRFMTVGRNMKFEVKTGNETHSVDSGSRTTTIHTDETLTVQTGSRTTTIQQDETLTVNEGARSITVKKKDDTKEVTEGNHATTVKKGDITIEASLGAITISAMKSITLKVGSNSITIDTKGITVDGAMVTSQATGVHTIKGLPVQIN